MIANMHRIMLSGAVALALLLPASAGPLGLPVPKPSKVIGDTLSTVRGTVDDTAKKVTGTVDQVLDTARLDPAGRPVNPVLFEKDTNGDRVISGVVIAVDLSDRAREAADAIGLEVARTETLDPLDIEVTRFKLPPELGAAEALTALRIADPAGTFDYEHVYDPAGRTVAGATSAALPRIARDDVEIGMIDAGVDRGHPALADADIVVKTTTEARGPSRPTAHGTAVASLLVGDDGAFQGALPGATLYAADAFAGSATGGSAADIARAIAWLADKDVPVINISIAGPKNAVLEAAVRGATQRGHVIVAPVGNDGPAAPVRYPAAFDGVVAVTSVDARRRVQIDANRGAAVAFAAYGVDVRAAGLGGAYAAVTGTSFASPLVAARFAELLAHPNKDDAGRVRSALVAEAGSNERRNPIVGYGILVPPAQAMALERTTTGD
jgi:Subtilase family